MFQLTAVDSRILSRAKSHLLNSRRLPTHHLLFGFLLSLATMAGCAVGGARSGLPESQEVTRGQLVIHSNFHLPQQHRLLDELDARRGDISELLNIPSSDEPIHVYLFGDRNEFQTFMLHSHPEFPSRRAFFVKDDTNLKVFAFWGARVAEDLRHEVTHGYLHSVIPNIPLWLDEGIAEYFEVARGKGGINGTHIYHLSNELRRNAWEPDLAQLESLTSAGQLTQTQYAESWLWVHFLLSGDEQSRAIIQDALSELRESGVAQPILPKIELHVPDYETQLLVHLKNLARD